MDFLSTREHYFRRSLKTEQNEQTNESDFHEMSLWPQSVIRGVLQESSNERFYSGEVIRAYNHGPPHFDKEKILPFFEFDTYSPAKELKKGDSVTHTQHTLHIYADTKTLEYLVRAIFHLDAQQIFNSVLA